MMAEPYKYQTIYENLCAHNYMYKVFNITSLKKEINALQHESLLKSWQFVL